MIELSPDRIAAAAGAEVTVAGAGGRPERAVVDSRELRPGDLFFGLPGEHADGGEFAARALEAGAWGVVVEAERARSLASAAAERRPDDGGGWVLAAPDPLAALTGARSGLAARAGMPGRRDHGVGGQDVGQGHLPRDPAPARPCQPGELQHRDRPATGGARCPAARREALVLEMAMRGRGQIAELCEIAEPNVAAITNIGPVHLELLGTLEAIAEAKAEILAELGERGRAVVPADAEALEPHLHDRLVTITFGPGGDVFALGVERRRALDPGHDRHARPASSASRSRSARRTTSPTPWRRSRSARRSRCHWMRWRSGRRG